MKDGTLRYVLKYKLVTDARVFFFLFTTQQVPIIKDGTLWYVLKYILVTDLHFGHFEYDCFKGDDPLGLFFDRGFKSHRST